MPHKWEWSVRESYLLPQCSALEKLLGKRFRTDQSDLAVHGTPSEGFELWPASSCAFGLLAPTVLISSKTFRQCIQVKSSWGCLRVQVWADVFDTPTSNTLAYLNWTMCFSENLNTLSVFKMEDFLGLLHKRLTYLKENNFHEVNFINPAHNHN